MAAVAGSVAWGAVIGARPVSLRPGVEITSVDSTWYQTLPADPDAATQAYLRRAPAEIRARGAALSISRYGVVAVRIVVLVGSTLLILFTGLAGRMGTVAHRVARLTPLQDALAGLQLLVVLFLVNLPVETYAGFIRPHLAGLSRQPYPAWLTDQLVNWAVITVFDIVGIVLVVTLMRRRPASWAGWGTAIYGALAAFYLLILPQYIEPLSNRITPLPDSPRKEAILSLARANGVPAADIFVRDASRQGVVLNAHVSGFLGTARITLDDNTIEQASDPAVMWVMAHEVGHYVMAHGEKEVVFDTLVMGLGLVFVGWAGRGLIGRFAARWRVTALSDIGALPLFWGLFLLWGFIAMPITNTISREQEGEADLYGLNASQEPLGLAELAIGKAGLTQLNPPPLLEWIFFDHPSPMHRIYSAMRWRAERLPQ
jgi:Zn-dependent protease with chaperone function